MVHVWPYVNYDLLWINMDKISNGTTVLDASPPYSVPAKYVRRSTEYRESSMCGLMQTRPYYRPIPRKIGLVRQILMEVFRIEFEHEPCNSFWNQGNVPFCLWVDWV
jgi:hypothetical protein